MQTGIKNYFYIFLIFTILLITIKSNEEDVHHKIIEDSNAPEYSEDKENRNHSFSEE